MTDSHNRPVRKYRTDRRRARISVAMYAFAALSLATFTVIGISIRALPETPRAAASSQPDAVLIREFVAAQPSREVYRHSVIDGGAYTPAELTSAIHRDPVVADHYRSIKVADLRSETVDGDEFAYMS